MSAIRKLAWPGFATLVALAILMSLGFWQLGRMVMKRNQISALESAMSSSGVSLNDLVRKVGRPVVAPVGGRTGGQVADLTELTRVTVEGVFLPVRGVPVRATLPATRGAPASGIGFFWMAPLMLDSGEILFVNRGFVPSGGDWKAPAIAAPEGPQRLHGLARVPEKPGTFTPPDNPARAEYFSRDPAAMARAAGVPADKVLDMFVDAERQPGSLAPPIGVDAREMIARIPNNHLQYAVTWFGLAASLLGVFAFFARARLRGSA